MCAALANRMPNTCGSNTFDEPYGCDYFYAIHSLMLDRPYLGQKTLDVLRVLEWLAAHGYDDVHLVATGWGCAGRHLRRAVVTPRETSDAQACADLLRRGGRVGDLPLAARHAAAQRARALRPARLLRRPAVQAAASNRTLGRNV